MIWLSLAFAGDPPNDPVVQALTAELDRNLAGLRMEGSPSPYFISYCLQEGSSVEIEARFGALVSIDDDPTRSLYVAVRVGDKNRDNGNFERGFRDTGFSEAWLPVSLDPLAVRRAAWRVTDDAWRDAVETLAAKEGALRGDDDTTPDFTFGEPTKATRPAPTTDPDRGALVALAKHLSARLRGHEGLEDGVVHLVAHAARRVTLDTSGVRVQEPIGEVDVRVVATVRSGNARLTDHASWTVRTLADLPPKAALEAGTDALLARLDRWRAAKAQEEAYIGPVLFEGEASVELFQMLLLPRLSGTPAPKRDKAEFGMPDDGPGPMALKRRILPPGFSVVDDPTATPALPSSYTWDAEGQPGRKIELVRDGIVVDHYMSRIPSEDHPGSNGHGFAIDSGAPVGTPAQVSIVSADAKSAKALTKMALKLARPYDLDHVLVVKRLTDPRLRPDESGFSFMNDEEDTFPGPAEVVFRYADGREEPVRGLTFEDIDLKGIIAAGPSTTLTVLHRPDPTSAGYDDVLTGLPTTITAPSVLVSELAMIPDEASEPPLKLQPPR